MTKAPKFPRTWDEQKKYETQVRKRWLESLAAMGVSQAAVARYAGIERSLLLRTGKKHGVSFQSEKQIAAQKRREEAKARTEVANRARAEQAARSELARLKSEYLAKGFTEQQAMRAVAHQLGVAL